MTQPARERLSFIAAGRVQGVCYRAFTVRTATALGLTGWVRNLPDGRVEGLAEGPRAALDALLAACRDGPRAAHVTELAVEFSPATGELSDFSQRETSWFSP